MRTMTPKLRALLVSVGVLTAAGGVLWTIYEPRPDATNAELVDAGILDGTPARVACWVRLTPEGVAWAQDAGWTVDPSRPYARPARKVRAFGGTKEAAIQRPRYVPLPDGGSAPAWVTLDRCKVVPRVDGGVPADDVDEEEAADCACRGASGVCRVGLPDGGTAPAPTGETLGPGYRWETWGGAGCIAKSCATVLSATTPDESWPAECP